MDQFGVRPDTIIFLSYYSSCCKTLGAKDVITNITELVQPLLHKRHSKISVFLLSIFFADPLIIIRKFTFGKNSGTFFKNLHSIQEPLASWKVSLKFQIF